MSTGQRQAQIIRLRIDQLEDDGIHFPPAKKGDAVIVEWTAALRDAIEAAKKMRPKIASATHLFSGAKGSHSRKRASKQRGSEQWQRGSQKCRKTGALPRDLRFTTFGRAV